MANPNKGWTRPQQHPRESCQPGGRGAEEGRRPGREHLDDQWQLSKPVQLMKTDIFSMADYFTATYVQSLVIQYVNFFVNKSMFNVYNMNMTKDLLHEKQGEKRQTKIPKGKKDIEDPKNRTRPKANRAKTKRYKKTRKTSTKRPRRRGGGNGSFGNFNFNFTISAGRHFQHHLHHRLKKKRGRKETEQINTKYVDQNLRHQNQKPKSRKDHRRPVEAYSRQHPLSPPQLKLQGLYLSQEAAVSRGGRASLL